MKLNEYKQQNGHTYESLGELLETPWRTVTDWCNKDCEVVVTEKHIEVIHTKTLCKVKRK